MWGATGLVGYLPPMGGQIAWLLAAAFASVIVLLWLRRSKPRTDLVRGATIAWAGWLLITWAAFSFGQRIIHHYYSVA